MVLNLPCIQYSVLYKNEPIQNPNRNLVLALKMAKNFLFIALLFVLATKLDGACPKGWETFKKNCYKRFPRKSFSDAVTACEGEDSKLAEVMGQAENDFIKNKFSGEVWIGVSRCHRASTCYLDFSPVFYTNWAAGEPNNQPQIPPGLANNEFAVVMQADGKWNDKPKQESHPYICKQPDDPCKDNFCNPIGSTCKDGKCICKPGFTGDYCYVQPCDTDPCQNGGQCKVVGSSYQCTCINYYSGRNCEVPPPCKTKKPCKNGVCVNINSADYKCNCERGWVGKNCDERPCDSKPCVNFQKCINEGSKFKCICLPKWTGERCEKHGNAWGDPHYTTFDGKRYDFMGKCEYIYAKDCSEDHAFEVLQQNEACGSGTISCTKSVRVLFYPHEIIMQRSRVVYVDGQRVSLPWENNGTKITKYGRGAFLSVPRLLFSVQWDGSTNINVNINQHYQGKMCGLMGNADGDPNNDFQLPNKTAAKNVAEFGNSWKKNPQCVNGIIPQDPCKKISKNELKAIREKCGKMKKPPFQQCNAKITPDPQHIPSCVYDMCAMKEKNPSAAFCQALETYDLVCRAGGVRISWEGQAGFEECGNPCANIPCFNGAKCVNLNRKEYKCTCPTGFTGPKCQNVVCKSGYISRRNICYRKMTRRPWIIARCPKGDQFVSSENVDENNFVYKEFVQKSKKRFWMNARVCVGNKLCRNDYGVVYYHNFNGPIPKTGCVAMIPGNGGKWITLPNCKLPLFYICKHEVF